MFCPFHSPSQDEAKKKEEEARKKAEKQKAKEDEDKAKAEAAAKKAQVGRGACMLECVCGWRLYM